MNPAPSRNLVLALGNDILGDDAVGLIAARRLRKESSWNADFIESAEAGLALMELMEGYGRVLLLDAVATGQHEAGTVLEFSREDFRRVIAPSVHYAGLPEMIALAERLEISFPREIRILAMEVKDPLVIREGLSPQATRGLPLFMSQASRILKSWEETGILSDEQTHNNQGKMMSVL